MMVEDKKSIYFIRQKLPDKVTEDGGKHAVFMGSFIHKSDTDPSVTTLLSKCSRRRYPVHHPVPLPLDAAHWKFLSVIVLPVQGPEWTSLLASGTLTVVSKIKPKFKRFVSCQAHRRREKMLCPPEYTLFPLVIHCERETNSLSKQSYQSKLIKSSLNEYVNSFPLTNIPTVLPCNGPTQAVSKAMDDSVPKADKPVKRNPKKKGRKRGRHCKRTLKKGNTGSESICETSICKIPAYETAHSCEEHMHRSPFCHATTSPNLAIQNSAETPDSMKYNNDNPLGEQMEWILSSVKEDETELAESFDHNQLHLDGVSSYRACSSSLLRTPQVMISAHGKRTANAILNKSNCRKGCGVTSEYLVHTSSSNNGSAIYMHLSNNYSDMDNNCSTGSINDHQLNDPTETHNTIDGSLIVSQGYNDDTTPTSIARKRGWHSRKKNGNANEVNMLGNNNANCVGGKDIGHYVWQRVQKNGFKGGIQGAKNLNPALHPCPDLDMNNVCSVPLADPKKHGRGKSCINTCSDKMSSQFHNLVLPLNALDTNKLQCKTRERKPATDIPEKPKRKHGFHPSRKGSHNVRRNIVRLAEVIQQSEAPEMLASVNHLKSFDSVAPAIGNADCALLDIQNLKSKFLHGEASPRQNICSARNDANEGSRNQLPLLMDLDYFEKECIEVHCGRISNILCKDSYHLDDNGAVCDMALEGAEGSLVENITLENYGRPILQKWIPVNKNDASVLNNRCLHSFSTLYSNKSVSVSEGRSSGSINMDTEDASSHCTQPSSSFLMHSSSCAKAPVLSIFEDEPANKLRDHLVSVENLSIDVFAPSDCLLTEEARDQCKTSKIDLVASSDCLLTEEAGDQCMTSKIDLDKIVQVVNDAYRLQMVLDGVHRVTGTPVAEIERILYSTSPVVGQMSNSGSCKLCPDNQVIGGSLCRHQTPNISLRDLWQWYEKPGSYGLEVKVEEQYTTRSGSERSEFCAYFVPYLSAVQLFGHSKTSTFNTKRYLNVETPESEVDEVSKNLSPLASSSLPIFSILFPPRKEVNLQVHECPSLSSNNKTCGQSVGEEVLFEYFESDQPQQRQPLHRKIKELIRGNASQNCQIFGDPSKLELLNLHDVHPASWYSVAWYPIYRIPNGNLRAAFLTYHSLGNFIRRNVGSIFTGGPHHIVSPVVGLQSYNFKGECWFQEKDFGTANGELPCLDPSEILKERLSMLERTAAVMARASVQKGQVLSVNRQPDYEFFLSRRL